MESQIELLETNTAAKELLKFYRTQLDHMKTLKKSDQKYKLIYTDSNQLGELRYDINNNAVLVEFSINKDNKGNEDKFWFQNLAHELNHAWQYETQELSLRYNGGGSLYDIYDEVESYNVSNQLFHGVWYYLDEKNSTNINTLLNDSTFLKLYQHLPRERRNVSNSKELMDKNKSEGIVEFYKLPKRKIK